MSTRTIIRRGTGWVLYRTAGGVIEFQWGTKDEKPDHPIRTDLRYSQTVPIVTVTIPPEAIAALQNEENACLTNELETERGHREADKLEAAREIVGLQESLASDRLPKLLAELVEAAEPFTSDEAWWEREVPQDIVEKLEATLSPAKEAL